MLGKPFLEGKKRESIQKRVSRVLLLERTWFEYPNKWKVGIERECCPYRSDERNYRDGKLHGISKQYRLVECGHEWIEYLSYWCFYRNGKKEGIEYRVSSSNYEKVLTFWQKGIRKAFVRWHVAENGMQKVKDSSISSAGLSVTA